MSRSSCNRAGNVPWHLPGLWGLPGAQEQGAGTGYWDRLCIAAPEVSKASLDSGRNPVKSLPTHPMILGFSCCSARGPGTASSAAKILGW